MSALPAIFTDHLEITLAEHVATGAVKHATLCSKRSELRRAERADSERSERELAEASGRVPEARDFTD